MIRIKYNSRLKLFSNINLLARKFNSYEQVAKDYNLILPNWWYDYIELGSITGKYIYEVNINSPGKLAYEIESCDDPSLNTLILTNGESNIYWYWNSRDFKIEDSKSKSLKRYLLSYYRELVNSLDSKWNKETYINVNKAYKQVIKSKLP